MFCFSFHSLFFIGHPQETLATLDKLDLDYDDEISGESVARKFGFDENGDLSVWQRTKPRIWALFDEPSSSTGAKVSVLAQNTIEFGGFFCQIFFSISLNYPEN